MPQFAASNITTTETLQGGNQTIRNVPEVPDHTFFIYALCDPETLEVRYVGYSKNPHHRYNAHRRDGYKSTTQTLNDWVDKLKSNGLDPLMILLDSVTARDRQTGMEKADEVETKWMAALSNYGFDLVNSSKASSI